MADIKIKDIGKKTIKALDKSVIVGERVKDSIVYTKTKAESMNDDSSVLDDGTQKIGFASNRVADEAVFRFNKHGKESVSATKDNVIKVKDSVNKLKIKRAEKTKIKKLNSKFNVKIKNVNKGIKNSKSTYKVAKKSIDNSKRGLKLAKETARKTAQSIKAAVKATISAIKGIIAGTKALIAAIVAGGWVAVVIIIILTMVGLLFGSIFGIFFSSESSGSGRTMNSVVMELNTELANKIIEIQNKETYDDYEIINNRAEWKDILALYVAKVSNGSNEADVVTLDDNKIRILKQIFWDMNEVTYTKEIKLVTDSYTDFDGNTTIYDPTNKTILYITVSGKSLEEMERSYFLTFEQKNQLNELLKEEYADLWASVIYGTSIGSMNMVEIAASQVGNVGGEPYWRWYGFNSRIEWCAVFVSWVANQAGYVEKGIVPKFSGVQTGIDWFKLMAQWKESGFIPNPGDIIFFDWEVDGKPNHVGIVEKVENNKVYTIEGNSTDDGCRKKEYDLNSKVIFGYGTPAY